MKTLSSELITGELSGSVTATIPKDKATSQGCPADTPEVVPGILQHGNQHRATKCCSKSLCQGN